MSDTRLPDPVEPTTAEPQVAEPQVAEPQVAEPQVVEPEANGMGRTAQPKPDRTIKVTFVLPAAAGARAAAIAGDFNDWSIDANPMERDPRGGFSVTLELTVGRHYEYRFWIDDSEWENDWYADAYVPNEYGGNNSQIDLTHGSARVRLHGT